MIDGRIDILVPLPVFLVAIFPPQMSEVKRLPERLECMVFRVRFAEEVAELQPVSDGRGSERMGGAVKEWAGQ